MAEEGKGDSEGNDWKCLHEALEGPWAALTPPTGSDFIRGHGTGWDNLWQITWEKKNKLSRSRGSYNEDWKEGRNKKSRIERMWRHRNQVKKSFHETGVSDFITWHRGWAVPTGYDSV